MKFKVVLFSVVTSIFLVFPRETSANYNEDFNSGFSNPSTWTISNRSGSVDFTSAHIQLLQNASAANSFPFVYNSLPVVPISGPFYLEFKFNYLSVGNFGDGIAITHQVPPENQYLDPNHRDFILFLVWQDPRGLQLYTTTCIDLNPSCPRNLTLLWRSESIDLSEHVLKASYNGSGQYSLFFDNLNEPIFVSSPNQPRPIGLWMGSPETTQSLDFW